MPVNTGDYAFQAYQILNAIHAQATGATTIAPINHDQFVSVAQKVLATGYERTLNAISAVIGRSMIAVRPYSRKFADLEATNDRWGGWVRKLSFGDVDVEEDPTYELVDGQAVDPFTVKKVPVLETKYIGGNVYEMSYTVYKRQLDVAFQDERAFMDFINGLTLHMSNLREMHLENLARQTLVALMLGRSAAETGTPSGVVHLLTEYNDATGLSLTATTALQPANIRGFFQWVIGRIAGISRQMTERSGLFQNAITGYKINRHTPREDQRLYLLAEPMEQIATQVNANTFNEEFLKLPEHELVSYFQAIDTPASISGTAPVLNADATLGTAAQTSETAVFGIIMDRDAAGYNVYQDELEPSIYNPKGQYWNIFYHVRTQNQIDLTEKSVLLLLD